MNRASDNQIAEAIFLETRGKTGVALAQSLANTVRFLARKRLLGKKNNILRKLERTINKDLGVVKAKVLSPRELSHEAKSSITHALKKRYDAKDVFLEEKIDEKLLGGIRVEVNDEVIDLSLKNRMNQLQTYLTRVQ